MAKAMEIQDETTCGKGLAANSWLPAKLAELTAALAAVLENHTRSIITSEENGKKEFDAYNGLVASFREIASRLDKAATQMVDCQDLPMAGHDMDALADPNGIGTFDDLVKRKRELVELLQKAVEEDQNMLAQMRGA
jgi:hypothetical protein